MCVCVRMCVYVCVCRCVPMCVRMCMYVRMCAYMCVCFWRGAATTEGYDELSKVVTATVNSFLLFRQAPRLVC
jgi:hypothetical protein